MFKIDFSDQKFRAIVIQTLVVGLLAYAIYFLIDTTAYNLDKRGIDPAIATGPFITTSNDIFGILIYFYIAKLILPF